MTEVTVILSAYAQSSLMERAAGIVLEREDLGHLVWTPAGIYEQLSVAHPDLYPQGTVPSEVGEELASAGFLAYLEERRRHRYVTRLPASLLQEAIGHGIVERVTPEIYRRLLDPVQLMMMDIDQLRKILKDGLALIAPPAAAKKAGKDKEQEGIGALTVDQLRSMTAALPPDQREAVAQAVARGMMMTSQVVDAEVLDES